MYSPWKVSTHANLECLLNTGYFFSKNSECFYKLNKRKCTRKWDKREGLATNAIIKSPSLMCVNEISICLISRLFLANMVSMKEGDKKEEKDFKGEKNRIGLCRLFYSAAGEIKICFQIAPQLPVALTGYYSTVLASC